MEMIGPQRSTAIREMLIGYVADHPARQPSRRPSFPAVLTGVLIGAGVATGAFAASTLLTPGPEQPQGQPSPQMGSPVAAPAGVIPGSPVIATLGDPLTVAFDRDTTVSLVDRPEEATHARVSISPSRTPGEAGSVTYGTNADGNNPSEAWGPGDVVSGPGTGGGWYDFPLDSTVTTLYISSTVPGTATIQYVTQTPTEFRVNDSGQPYGITGDERGEPDLIAVIATNGQEGYVKRTELEEADGTAAMRELDSPEDALAWQEAHAGEVSFIPVYESDGTTKIGDFQVGG